VCRLVDHPDWLFKEYLGPSDSADERRLDNLIRLPEEMDSSDRKCVDGNSAWPASRVLADGDDSRTVGVLLPAAPSRYYTEIRLPGRPAIQRELAIDLLALTAENQKLRSIQGQSLADRTSVCVSLTAVAAVLEGNNIVYLDWSYANAFWSALEHSAYLIDIDGCSFGPRPQIETHGWSDPLVPRGQNAGNHVDRYRVALLVARCLTGQRPSVEAAHRGLMEIRNQNPRLAALAHLLATALTAKSLSERPSVTDLNVALRCAAGLTAASDRPSAANETGRVSHWIPIQRPTPVNGDPMVQARTPISIQPRDTVSSTITARVRLPRHRARHIDDDRNGCGIILAVAIGLTLVVLLISGIKK
jgi:hypothetical protein